MTDLLTKAGTTISINFGMELAAWNYCCTDTPSFVKENCTNL